MRAILLAAAFTVAFASIAAAQTPPDVVELANGGSVRGTVVENIPGDHVTVQLVTGEMRTFAAAEVARVTMGSAAPVMTPVIVPVPTPPPLPTGIELEVVGEGDEPITLHRLTGTATVSVWTGRGVGTASIDAFEPICVSPCTTRIDPPATYTLGLSMGGGTARRAGHAMWSLDHDMTLGVEYESREGIRIGGWVIFGLGTAAFLTASLVPLAIDPGDTEGLLVGLSVGLGIYVVTLIPFFIMAFMNDHADIYELRDGIRF